MAGEKSLDELASELDGWRSSLELTGQFTTPAQNEYTRLLKQIEARKQSDSAMLTDYRGTAAFGQGAGRGASWLAGAPATGPR